MYGQPAWICSLNTTTPPNNSWQGGFERAGALVGSVAHCDDGDRSRCQRALQVHVEAVNRALQTAECCLLGVGQNRKSGFVAANLLGRWWQPRPSNRSRWRRNAELTRSVGCHESDVHFLQSLIVARSPQVAVAAAKGNVKAKPSNKPIKLTVHSVTGLACARPAPTWPAAYRQRWADLN